MRKFSDREPVEGEVTQGANERIAWRVDISEWGVEPFNPVTTVEILKTGEDVTFLVTEGAATVVVDVLVTPIIHSLTAGVTYLVRTRFALLNRTVEGEILEVKLVINADK